jgi:hypothetical protein
MLNFYKKNDPEFLKCTDEIAYAIMELMYSNEAPLEEICEIFKTKKSTFLSKVAHSEVLKADYEKARIAQYDLRIDEDYKKYLDLQKEAKNAMDIKAQVNLLKINADNNHWLNERGNPSKWKNRTETEVKGLPEIKVTFTDETDKQDI